MVLLSFSLTVDLYRLIPAMITQIFDPTAECAIPTETLTNEANAEIETHPLTANTKTRKCLH